MSLPIIMIIVTTIGLLPIIVIDIIQLIRITKYNNNTKITYTKKTKGDNK